jgi:hypothetical protein
MRITSSKIFTIDRLDILKALLMSLLTPALVIIQSSLDAGNLNFNWKAIGMAAVAGGGSYILKNFFSQSKVIIKEVPENIIDDIKANEPIAETTEPIKPNTDATN